MPTGIRRQVTVVILWSLLVTSGQQGVFLEAHEEDSALPVIPPLVVDKGSVSGPPARGQFTYEEERFVSGLRRRGLLDLAEKYCRQLLERGELEPERHVRLVSQLAWVFLDRARLSPTPERASLLQKADAILQEAASHLSEPSFRLLLSFEQTRIWSIWGQMLLEEVEFLGQGESERTACRSQLRKALEALQKMEPQVEELMRMESAGTEARPANSRGLSVFQLAELLKAIRFERGLCALALARSFPSDSPDRSAYVAEALPLFAELSTLPETHRLAWPSRILQVQALREGGSLEEAENQLLRWEKTTPPRPEALRLRAEKLRLHLARKDMKGAFSAVQACQDEELADSPELCLATVQVLLALAQEKEEDLGERTAGELQARLRALLALVQSHHDPVTLRKIRSLLARQMPATGHEDPETWAQAGEHAFHAGEYSRAVEAYDKAVLLGMNTLPPDTIWQYGLVAANITAMQGKHLEACLRYRNLALWQSQHPKAAEAHFLSIQQAALLAQEFSKAAVSGTVPRTSGGVSPGQADPPPAGVESSVPSSESSTLGGPLSQNLPLPAPLPATQEEVYALLRELAWEHLRQWPQASSADTVRILLARLLWQQRHYKTAIEVLGQISRHSTCFRQALEEMEGYLFKSRGQTQGNATPEILSAAEKALEQWCKPPAADGEGSSVESWARCSLLAVEVHLTKTPPATDRAEEILGQVIPWADRFPRDLQVALQGKLLTVYVLEGRVSEALPLGRQMAHQAPAELYLICKELFEYLSGRGFDPDSFQAECLKDLLEEMRQQKLDGELQNKVTRIWLEVWWQSGGSTEALVEARRWVAEAPSEPDRRLLLARLLLCEVFRSGDPGSAGGGEAAGKNPTLEEARQVWREVETSAQARSPVWYEAKAALALLALQAGDRVQAERIVRFMQVMHRSTSWLNHPAVARLLSCLPPSAGKLLQQLTYR